MNADYLKVPAEMAKFALSNSKTRQVQTYLASLFIFSGKARTKDRPTYTIAELCETSERTIYRAFEWLLFRNWIGKDEANGWFFFRGIDRIRTIEDWHFKRAGIMYAQDLKTIRAFCAGLVIASLTRTKKQEQRTEFQRGNSEPAAVPISAKALAKTLNLSLRSAQKLRKSAADCNYVDSTECLIPLAGLNATDLHRLQSHDLGISTDRIRKIGDHLFFQKPNLLRPMINLKNR